MLLCSYFQIFHIFIWIVKCAGHAGRCQHYPKCVLSIPFVTLLWHLVTREIVNSSTSSSIYIVDDRRKTWNTVCGMVPQYYLFHANEFVFIYFIYAAQGMTLSSIIALTTCYIIHCSHPPALCLFMCRKINKSLQHIHWQHLT